MQRRRRQYVLTPTPRWIFVVPACFVFLGFLFCSIFLWRNNWRPSQRPATPWEGNYFAQNGGGLVIGIVLSDSQRGSAEESWISHAKNVGAEVLYFSEEGSSGRQLVLERPLVSSMWRYIWKNYGSKRWFFVTVGSTFVNPQGLVDTLAGFDPKAPWYVGDCSQAFCSSGGGYLLNKEALDLIMLKQATPSCQSLATDQSLGGCLYALGVLPTRVDSFGLQEPKNPSSLPSIVTIRSVTGTNMRALDDKLSRAYCQEITRSHPGFTRGVAPQNYRYHCRSQEYFECGMRKIPLEQVNDNYCDCPNGKDEPATSACPNGRFWCSSGEHIFSSFVGDGICDCGDGSDEKHCNKGSRKDGVEGETEESGGGNYLGLFVPVGALVGLWIWRGRSQKDSHKRL